MAMVSPSNWILVAVDFSRGSEEAFAAAVELARRTNAGIEILHVLEPIVEQLPFCLPYYDDRSGLIAQIDREMVGLADQARKGGVRCRTKIVDGIAAGEILERSRDIRAQLIVVGAEGRWHRTGSAASETVAEKVRRGALCPVLTVPLPGKAA